jgi:hypothetical protein
MPVVSLRLGNGRVSTTGTDFVSMAGSLWFDFHRTALDPKDITHANPT